MHLLIASHRGRREPAQALPPPVLNDSQHHEFHPSPLAVPGPDSFRPDCLAFLALGSLPRRCTPPDHPPDFVANPAGTFLEFREPATFAGKFVNRGHIKVTDTVVHFTAQFIEEGHYESDPSDNYFGNWIVGGSGSVTSGPGDRFIVSRDFTNGSLRNQTWNTAASGLIFDGVAAHRFALAGSDAGPFEAGFVRNFAWNSLRLAAGQSLQLADGNATPGGALYVRSLILSGGIPDLTRLTGSGFNIYYDPLDPASAWLKASTWPMTGGGSIIPLSMSGEVELISTELLPGGTQRLVCRGIPLQPHRIRVSADLVSFITAATITAGADGHFTWDDPASPVIPRRFYRVDYP